MIQNESANPLLRIADVLQPVAQAFDNGREGVFLNQVEQSLFRFEVVVQARQRHAARPRKIAHGRPFVSLFIEHIGGMHQDLGQPAIEAGPRPGSRPAAAQSGGVGNWEGWHCLISKLCCTYRKKSNSSQQPVTSCKGAKFEFLSTRVLTPLS